MGTAYYFELAFRLWSYLISGWIRHPTDEIAKTSPAAGWKGLPQELVDEILGYSMDDLDALKACSLTCKHLFDSTRPLIHQRLCLVSGPARPKSEGSPSGRGQVDHGAFGRLVDADGSGLLRYTRHLTFKGPAGTFTIENRFSPRKMQEHLPRLRSITRLQRLTFDSIDVLPFFPVFDEYFGMFTNTVRQLDIRVIYGTGPQLLYFICQFPLLEDLTIISPSNAAPRPGDSVPVITRSPPLRGKLVLSNVYSGRLTDGLAVLPCGLNFHSLELHRCKPSQVFLTACGHTVTSVSYSWHTRNLQNFENSPALDFERSVVLERFEFTLQLSSLSQLDGWVYDTLRTITSPQFSEFVMWILKSPYPPGLRYPMSADGWEAVDGLLYVLSKRNPDFRVVFKGDFRSFHYSSNGEDPDIDVQDGLNIRSLIDRSYFPLVSSYGLVTYEQVPLEESRFWKLGVM